MVTMARLPLAPAPLDLRMKAMVDSAQQNREEKARSDLSAVGSLFMPRSMRLRMIIHGTVVGVFFRAFIEKSARELKLTGWVRNTEQKTVEVIAEGALGALQDLLARCKKGPEAATVSKIDDVWMPATGEFTMFEIKY